MELAYVAGNCGAIHVIAANDGEAIVMAVGRSGHAISKIM